EQGYATTVQSYLRCLTLGERLAQRGLSVG
ncbi:MAG: hypothetical protein FD135_4247, partial [Comamonadaceae bacterium]